MATALDVGNPARHSRDLPEQADPRVECPIEIDVDEIRSYEGNPRRAANAKFEGIKASIRASGIRSPLTVTRRPGERHFIVEAGGNTRLEAIRQLWAETGDARFRRVTVLFRPWKSETHVLAAHLSENEQRGGMTFWDKACGYMRLKAQLEAEHGHVLTLRHITETLRGLGLPVNVATLTHFGFATERLRTLGEGIPDFNGMHVRALQPRLNQLRRLAWVHGGLNEDSLYADVLEPAFVGVVIRTRGETIFSAEEVLRASAKALARHLGIPTEALTGDLLGGERTSDATESETAGADAVSSSDGADDADETGADRDCATPTRRAERIATSSPDDSDKAMSVLRLRMAELMALPGRGGRERGFGDDPLPLALVAPDDGGLPEPEPATPLVRDLLQVVTDAVGNSPSTADVDDMSRPANAADPDPRQALLRWLLDATDPVAEAGWRVLLAARDVATARRETQAPGDD